MSVGRASRIELTDQMADGVVCNWDSSAFNEKQSAPVLLVSWHKNKVIKNTTKQNRDLLIRQEFSLPDLVWG